MAKLIFICYYGTYGSDVLFQERTSNVWMITFSNMLLKVVFFSKVAIFFIYHMVQLKYKSREVSSLSIGRRDILTFV